MKNVIFLLSFMVTYPIYCAPLEVNGIKLGLTPCDEAIQKAYQNYFQQCWEVAELNPRLAEKKKQWELCQWVGEKGVGEEKDRFAKWDPSGEPCYACPDLAEVFRRAFGLERGVLNFARHNLGSCPFSRFYVDSRLGSVVCLNGKVVFFHKSVPVRPRKVSEHLKQKYGAPEKEWKKGNRDFTDNFGRILVKYSLFSAEGGKILFIDDGKKKNPVSKIYYFTDDFIKLLKNDTEKYLSFHVRQSKEAPKIDEKKEKKYLDEI